ncbi:hypothetical protein BZL30_9450 [Mycobacterium kansasii]|uniref:Uncharacterized protein n=1 Tax=Mycobacterium kansasii TaxID=1768 RepID=A0A1V3W955_MYCKA|nr:hypothetical protein BZL30_9450 [Mycobacterium kansasii]
MTRIATAAVAAHPGITVVEALRLKGLVRDSVGLGTSARERNLAGRVCCEAAPVRRSRDRRRCRHHRGDCAGVGPGLRPRSTGGRCVGDRGGMTSFRRSPAPRTSGIRSAKGWPIRWHRGVNTG